MSPPSILLWSLCAGLLSGLKLMAATHVSGFTDYELYSVDGKRRLLVQERFSAFVERERWFVTTELLNTQPPARGTELFCPPSQVMGSDGGDTYCIKHLANGTNKSVFASVEPGSVPTLRQSTSASLIWLAFCAGYNLPQTGESELRPIWGDPKKRSQQAKCKMDVRYTRNREVPELLDQLCYICDGRVDPCNPSTDKTNMMGPGWSAGFTQAVLRVESMFKTGGGLMLPQTFTFNSFTPRPHSDGELVLASKIRGSVTNATPDVHVLSWLPPVPTNGVVVRDYRFTESVTNWNAVSYKITNQWRMRGDSRLMAYVRTYEQIAPIRKVTKRQVIWMRISVALFCLLPPVVAALWYYKKRKTTRETL